MRVDLPLQKRGRLGLYDELTELTVSACIIIERSDKLGYLGCLDASIFVTV